MTNSAIKWHGGKSYLAKDIIKLMPSHLHYVEPYFGGGAVLLAKNPIGISEVVNDIHGGLTNFWQVLQDNDTFLAFQRKIEAMPFSQVEFEKARVHYTTQGGSKCRRLLLRILPSISCRADERFCDLESQSDTTEDE